MAKGEEGDAQEALDFLAGVGLRDLSTQGGRE